MTKTLLSLATVAALCGLPVQAQDKPKTEDKPVSNSTADEVAVINTTEGTMVAEFWPDVAPKHVENFKKLAKSGFYDGTAFHRVIKGFMIQGGDPLTKDDSKQAMWGTGGPGWKVDAEFNKKSHVRGVLSAARSQDPNSAGSQFFLMHADAPFLDGQYTGFGKATSGLEVIDKIVNLPRNASDRPHSPAKINKITIEEK